MPKTTPEEREQWKLVLFYQKYFWDRWKAEFLPRLLKRTKWQNKAEPIKIDDIVALAEDGLPGSWLKGRVTNVYPGKDGQVRVADVETIRGKFTRKAGTIAVLDLSDKEPLLITASTNLIEQEKINNTEQAKRKGVDTTFPNWGKKNKKSTKTKLRQRPSH